MIVNLKLPPLMLISPFVVMYPQAVVEWIRDANGGEKDQGPLKDAPGRLPAEIMAELHAKPPTRATDASTKTTGRAEKPAISEKLFANKAAESNALSAAH